MKPLRTVLAASLVFCAIVAAALPAMAAPPSNDTIGGATPIAALPFGETLNTTEATTDADDAAVNANCGAPATDASVWYSLTVATDTDVVVDVSASDYSAGVIVASGSPGSLSLVTCGAPSVVFTALAAESYFLLAFDFQDDGGGNGGLLSISVSEAPPAPEVSLTIDPVGHFSARAGSATISGTVLCSGEAFFTHLEGTLSQQVGRFTIRGGFSTDFVCDGAPHAFTAEAVPDNGKFAGGQATASAFAQACGASFRCGEDSAEQQVRLRR